MANLLFRLILFFAGVFVLAPRIVWCQYDKPFSHAVHLKLKVACLECHTQASISTKAQDNLLPAADACKRCHEPGPIGEPAKLRVTQFNHQFHLKMGNVAPVILAAVRSRKYMSWRIAWCVTSRSTRRSVAKSATLPARI